MAHLAVDWLLFFSSLRAAALWECLPVYLGRRTPRVTDGHLRHLSRPIVRTPYRTGPSAGRVGSLPALLTLLHVFTL